MTKINLERGGKNVSLNFKLGDVDLKVTFLPKSTQRGNLWVHDIGKYVEIQPKMKSICSSVRCARIVQAIREARQTGNPLTTRSFDCEEVGKEVWEDYVKFLNRFMFLWNCEIARHLQTPITEGSLYRDEMEREYHDLPVAVGICLANRSIEKGEREPREFRLIFRHNKPIPFFFK